MVRLVCRSALTVRSPVLQNNRPELAVADAIGNVTLYSLTDGQVSLVIVRRMTMASY